MDTAELIKFYKRPCFIFNDSIDSTAVKIDDDEIIDLDSLSLDSNEDTWLLPNSKDNSYKELSKEKMKARLDSVSMDGSGDLSLISLSNWDFKEETSNGTFFSPASNANNYLKKLEFDAVDKSLGSVERTIVRNKIENYRKLGTPLNECDTFKKPLPKNQTFEMSDDVQTTDRVIEHEKNHAELNGTAKKKTVLNKSMPISHSTPLPMLRRHLTRRSNDHAENDTSPVISSSTSSAENIHINVEPEPVSKFATEGDPATLAAALEMLDITVKDNASPMFETHDDNKSTSSSDSRRSSSSSIPRTVVQSPSNTFSRSSPSNHRLSLGGNRNVFSPSKAGSAKKTLFNENKIREPTRRTPSLSRLQAPSVNIDEEFVSVVEIKSKVNEKKPSSAPTSHIPRPSTRIPVFRTSNSCTRASKK